MAVNGFAEAVRGGEFVITADFRLPRAATGEQMASCAKALAGAVHAVYAGENDDGAALCGLAACSHLVARGVEPILGLLTRDLNRIALQAQILGAASIGVTNILCLAGRHQTLMPSRGARGVFDVDPIQLVAIADAMRTEGRLADGQMLDAPVELTIGAQANPFAEPVEMNVMALEKAVRAGADFVITQPVFNLDRFNVWMTYVRERDIHNRTCIIASVMPVTDTLAAVELAEKYRHLDIGDDLAERLDTASDRRAAGIHFAAETAAYLAKVQGVRGINVMAGDEPALAVEVLKASGFKRS